MKKSNRFNIKYILLWYILSFPFINMIYYLFFISNDIKSNIMISTATIFILILSYQLGWINKLDNYIKKVSEPVKVQPIKFDMTNYILEV
jgi:hypothetical protein